MVYVSAPARRGYPSLKNERVWGRLLTDHIGLFARMRVSEVGLNKENRLKMPRETLRNTHAHTHAHIQSQSFSPDMSSLGFSTEDIPTERDRTSRTAGPAGTAPASSTGTCSHASPGEFTYSYCLFNTRAKCVSPRSAACVALSFRIASLLGAAAR